MNAGERGESQVLVCLPVSFSMVLGVEEGPCTSIGENFVGD